MWSHMKWIILFSLWAARLVRQPTVPLRVSGGLVRGTIAPDGSHLQYLAIPYATVTKRFQAAEPEPKWEGILDANNENVRCVQRFTNTMILGEEDCLTLNIYTPLEQTDNLLPVMVFIHGGGFRDGSGSPFLYGPEYLVKHNIILVTFNYRLEILGFLCLGISEAPGNVGLKDQVEAFRWIKKNIKSFGGDPDNVTIFGESAGSASVLYHLLSPMSKGLFNKAIMQSGSAMSPWSLQFEPLETASLLAKQMGYETENPYKIYDIFMNKSAKELMSARIPRTEGDVVLSENIFVPCVEKEIPNVEQFLTDTPYNLMTKSLYNKIPVILGYNNAEGYMFVAKENDTTIPQLSFTKSMPRDLKFPSEKEKSETANRLKEIYMGEEKISKKTLLKFSKFEGDSGISYPVVATADLLLRTNNNSVYMYKFCYDGWLNIAKIFFGYSTAPGATHADDLFYMFRFKIPLFNAFFEMNIVSKVTTMWTNFAKYSNPTPNVTSLLPIKWPAGDKKNPRVLVIDKEFYTAPLWDSESLLLWNKTYSKYRRKT